MEKIWLNAYPQGVSSEISEIPEQRTLIDLLQENVEQFGKQPAYSSLGTELSYQQTWQLSENLAAFLQHLGLKKGDRVALMMPNVLQYPVAMFAALRAGLTVVNINPLYTARELAEQMNDADVSAMIILANFANTLQRALPKIQVKHIIVTQLGDLLGGIKKPLVNFVVKNIKKMVPHYELPNAITLSEALTKAKNLVFKPVELCGQDLAFLQYTGGTTGKSKGAKLSHYNILANVEQCFSWLGKDLDIGKEAVITALPLYHIFSLTVCCFVFFRLGGKAILIVNPRDMKDFIKTLKKERFTIMLGVNTLFNGLLNQEAFTKLDFSQLKLTVGGGMSIQEATAKRWKAVTKKTIIQGYGLTETSPVVTINPITLQDFNGSIGVPVPSTDIAVLNEEGNELAVGEIGELVVKGPQVMQGYWQQPEATKAVFHHGWLKTGDMAKVDEQGFVYLIDRKKDMVIVSGFNVYPNEVEEVIAGHPGVAEVGVIGLPSETSGEVVTAFIVKKDDKLTEDEIIRYCRELLTAYKIPKLVEFKEELPKTPVGKILRRKLKESM